ncbi:MAG: hypothetical protein JW776_13470 [Candidatus Lokiarchaeota archaeon]|nr:hypothetical protein [Candidatus Lokiarchaeota archaeon]
MNQMFKKYLIKNNFWLTKKKNDASWFVKHTPASGGIYARLMQKGVEIQHSGEKIIFTNFNELDDYLERITSPRILDEENEFVNILNRKISATVLRTLPL